ncbi:hypothetical protein JCM11251_007954 [Rhodosporidiobolus azoricus]
MDNLDYASFNVGSTSAGGDASTSEAAAEAYRLLSAQLDPSLAAHLNLPTSSSSASAVSSSTPATVPVHSDVPVNASPPNALPAQPLASPPTALSPNEQPSLAGPSRTRTSSAGGKPASSSASGLPALTVPPDASVSDTKALKAAHRKERNRLAAQRSRDKKSAAMDKMESEIEDLKRENERLRGEVREVEVLRRRVKELEGIVDGVRGVRGLVPAEQLPWRLRVNHAPTRPIREVRGGLDFIRRVGVSHSLPRRRGRISRLLSHFSFCFIHMLLSSRSFSFSFKRTALIAALLSVVAALLFARLTPTSSTSRGFFHHLRSMSTAQAKPRRNVVVVGGSYVGQMVAKELMGTLNSEEHRVVVVDRNSHFGHLFAYPRFAIAPSHEHKAFLPFKTMLPAPHAIVQAEVTNLVMSKGDGERKVVLDRAVQLDEGEGKKKEIEFEALVLATGTKLSKPGTLDPEKANAVKYLQGSQKKLEAAKDIVIIGGGAVGVQMATDLAILYPSPAKNITLVQSRRLMPRFHPALHSIVQKRFDELGVNSITGVKAKVPEGKGGYEELNERGGGEVELSDGRKIRADHVIHALGQVPSSSLLSSSLPSAINPSNNFVRVKPSLLIAPVNRSEEDRVDARVWAVGDIADSGAPKAARPAMQQAEIVAKDIAKRLRGEPESSFAVYTPGPAAIHLTLGIVESIIFRNPPSHTTDDGEVVWDGEPEYFWKDDGKLDMGIEGVWERRLPGFINGDVQRYHL